MRTSVFIVFLINVITNSRIWISLHKIGSMKILKEVFSPVTMMDEIQTKRLGVSLTSLNDSQADAVLSCISTMKCEHRSTVKLVRGPPGTGKTKTVSTLLCVLLKMNYNIVACAPTNVAIAELSTRVLKLVKEPYELDPGMRNSLYSLGDLLLFGNNEYLQLDGDLKEIFLDYRVDKLAEFLGRNSWKYYFISLIDVLENCVSQYDIFMENASKSESEAVKESGSGRCSGHSFLKFIRERFTDAALPLKRCITTLGTCLTADFLLQHNYKNMSILLGLLDSFECVLSRDDVVEEELKELFAEEVLNKNASLSSRGLSGNETVKCHSLDLFYKIRCESLILLKSLSNDLNLPGHMDTGEIRDLCFSTASLIFCTASSSFKLHSVVTKQPQLVVIDEAAQLKESESTIPLQLSGIQHVFLIGDECQLPAMIHSEVSEIAGFGRSLFERLSAAGHPKHLLNMQFRMHPEISFFPNSIFYLSDILDAPNVKDHNYEKHCLPGPMFGPYSFISVSNGKEEFDDMSHSRRNLMEVAVVLTIVQNLFKGMFFFSFQCVHP
ncbi:hypothetical protein IFM89_015933 [Coptis chinensis]|uniref:Uncharacterized protein n=1 Tax=Coptis chinensis TaxID=261450 RepID=A0A835HD27_9MAGN|nr:hypothetical protein IFM89_015933 [Coptis chinensis]